MRRLIPFAAIAILALAPVVAANTLIATAPVAVSATGASPFGITTCTNEDLATEQSHSTLFLNGEVEPWVASDPGSLGHLVGAYQQDRWEDGASRGIVSAKSSDGGGTWTANTQTKSSFCTGGTVGNGGDFQRATDPWTSISPDGTAYLMTLSIGDPNTNFDNAMLVMRSTDSGATWANPTTLIRENLATTLNDKNSLTADPNDSNFVYAVWDRLEFPNAHARAAAVANAFPFKGPIYFSRTTDGGANWSAGAPIFGNGSITQTIGNQIVVLPDLNNGTFEGQLVDGFNYRSLRKSGNVNGFDNVAVILSSDHGATWSKSPIIVSKLYDVPVVDPDTLAPIRSAEGIPEFAVNRSNGTLYAVWEDGRFSSFAYAEVAFSQSTDGGLTWSDPIKIDKTPGTGLNAQAFEPAVHVLPDGTVGVTYYDFRNNGSGTPALETDYFMVHCHATCTTAGNWSENQITPLASSFDLRKAPNARGYFLGDYQGLTHTTVLGVDNFVAFFGQANSASDPSTIYASDIAP
jgi:hypothetical protein